MRRSLILLWLSVLGGCSLLPSYSHCTRLAEGVPYCLAAPDPAQPAERQVQRITIAYPDGQLALMGVEEQQANAWVLAAAGPLGQPSLSLRWDGETLSQQLQGLPGQFDPVWLMALVQVMAQPERLADVAGQWHDGECDVPCQRYLRDGNILFTVAHGANWQRLEHHPYGITMTVTTLSREPL